jgi:flagellar protein FliS
MAVNPYEVYRQQEVFSANRGDLLLMLYDGCIKQLKLARLFIEEKGIEDANNALIKAQNIISELMNGLDMQYEISGQLLELYSFFRLQLIQANIRKDASLVEPILEMMTDLRETWRQAIQLQKAQTIMR